MPINNHAVLLKGVNDSLAIQRELCRALLRIKVRPYYLFHCDPVTGAGPLPHAGLEGDRDHRGPARPHLGPGRADLRRRRPPGGGKIPLDAELPALGLERLGRPPQL